jgi:superfamily II DNA/RNA helicase
MDRMLDLGFIHQIEDIMKNLPKERQTIMLSATFPKRIAALASKYLIDPVRVEIDAPNSVSTNVKQETIEVEGNAKLKELTKLLESFKKQQVLVFAKTQRTVGEMAKYLAKSGFAARALHGGLKQSKRDEVVKDFRAAAFNVLIATDVAARGLDIPKIAYVVNYELPQVPEEYIHRIGRTGRADKKGTAFTLLARADKSKWKQIKKFLQGDDGKMPAQIKWPAKAEQIIPTSGEPLQKPEKITRKTPPAQIKRKFGFKAEKEEINKKSVIKKIAVKKPAAIAPVKAEKKPEKKGAFKISYVGKKKEEKPKKYGRHQSKKWALIAERKYNHGKKFKKRKKR